MKHLRQVSVFVFLGVVLVAGFGAWKVRYRHRPNTRPQEGIDQPARRGHRTLSPWVTGTIHRRGRPVAGATVTVVDLPNTHVTTQADGNFSLSLPVNSTHLVRVSRPDASTVQSMVVVGATSFDIDSIDDADRDDTFHRLGLTADPSRGTVLVRFEPPQRTAGYGVTLNVSGGTRFVVARSRPTRQETTTGGDSQLVIANVPTGTVTVTPVTSHGSCTPTFGTASVHVDPQTITYVSFDCD